MKTYYIYVNDYCIVRVEETEPNTLHIKDVEQFALSICSPLRDVHSCHIAIYEDGLFVKIINVR